MITLTEALDKTGMTLQAAGALVGLGKSAGSRIKSHDYPNWTNYEISIIRKMVDGGMLDKEHLGAEGDIEPGNLKLDPTTFIPTINVVETNNLANGLLDPTTTLNSSIGMIVGSAGYGKTTAIKHFASESPQAAYILYMEGYTLTMLLKTISIELTGTCQRYFDQNLALIKEATSTYRKLVIIDEADRMPIRLLEALRNINEFCGAPLLLVGEKALQAKLEAVPRLKSRIRKPEIAFVPINVTDVATFYQMAVGIDISEQKEVCRQLLRWAGNDFRNLVNDAQHIVSSMNTSGVYILSEEVLNAYKPLRS